jgi:hypothetical protein
MDITNNQRQLFGVVECSYLRNGVSGKPIEDGIRLKNYADRINLSSYANYPYERYGQLDMATHIGGFGKENSQSSKLPQPFISCNPRPNETSSRFNYAMDMCVDKRLIDVSGIDIPNNKLRVIPNRGTQLCYQNRNLPSNPQIEALSKKMLNITVSDVSESNGMLKFKASRQRLNREELLGVGRVPAAVAPTVPGVP